MTIENTGGSVREPVDSLYAQEQRAQLDANVPWWQRNLLLSQPALFGTWDGVFTTVMVNIFGIIVFLRMGWIVGTAGVASAILLLAICTSLALITVFSAIGIVERCQIQSGGIYFLVSHVLGGQIGGAVGIIYAFGQAVATGLVAVGFGESVVHLFESESRATVKIVAIVTILLLTAVNAAGVSWVIRLQLILLSCLALAAGDFFLGSLWTVDPAFGVAHISTERMRANAQPHYEATNCSEVGIDVIEPAQSFYTVFGVFFANFLGVLAGVNMSGDLREPHKSIPLGELSAVAVSSTVCLLFILVLGSTVERPFLICDHLISEKVSLTGFVFMCGLYICSLSSVIGSLLGTPRVLQGIAAEGIVPLLNPLARGSGPNKNPLLAAYVMMGVACIFVLLGDLNTLAILSTMPFLITYAYVNYAYVSLAMSYDLESVNTAVRSSAHSYGSMQQIAGATGANGSDLDALFPSERAREATPQTSSVADSSDLEGGTTGIVSQPTTWYSMFSNRYIAFVGCLVNLVILVFVNWTYALLHFAGFALLYFYIGQVCPTAFPGISQFSISHMFCTAFSSLETIGMSQPGPPSVIPAQPTPADYSTAQLNDPNPDYTQRKPYHHADNMAADFD